MVVALADLMTRSDVYGEVFNVGSSEEITILDLARRVITITQTNSEVTFIPYDEAYGEGFEDMSRRVPDTTKIELALGWHPTAGLDEMITDVVRHDVAAVHVAV